MEVRSLMNSKKIYLICAIVLFVSAFFAVGYHHVDEHIQILEFAGLKLNLTLPSQLPWEYHFQIRPTLQPWIVVFLSKLLMQFNVWNPFFVAFVLRLLSAALAFFAMWRIFKTYIDAISHPILKKWFLFLSFLLWFAVYNAVRFSSENWSGSVFIIAFAWLVSEKSLKKTTFLYIGFLLGLSFLFRYQSGFLIAGLVLWYVIVKKEFINSLLIIIGIVALFGIGVILDFYFYGEWTCSAWNYFSQNIIQNKVSSFGIEPWWFYFSDVFLRVLPPYSLLLIMGFILVFIFKPKDALSWTMVPFLCIHLIIGHKETRFLFPIIGFVPIVIIKSIGLIQEKWVRKLFEKRYFKVFTKSFVVVNIVFLAVVTFKPTNDQIALFSTIYTDYQGNTELYFIENNPYKNIYFYKRSNLEVKEIKSIQEINLKSSQKQLIVVNNIKLLDGFVGEKKLMYASFPDWVFNFNFNHWIERSNYWQLYELSLKSDI